MNSHPCVLFLFFFNSFLLSYFSLLPSLPPLLPTPMIPTLPTYSGVLVFSYFPCGLDPCAISDAGFGIGEYVLAALSGWKTAFSSRLALGGSAWPEDLSAEKSLRAAEKRDRRVGLYSLEPHPNFPAGEQMFTGPRGRGWRQKMRCEKIHDSGGEHVFPSGGKAWKGPGFPVQTSGTPNGVPSSLLAGLGWTCVCSATSQVL